MSAENAEPRNATENGVDKQKIDVLEVVVKKCTGTVKWYSHKLLYGFISRKDNQEDVFVHRTAISEYPANARSPNLRNGEEVEFSVVRTTNGLEAYHVTGPEGAPVQGFVLHRRRRRRLPNGAGDAEESAEQVNGEEDNTKVRGPRRRRGGGRGGRGGSATHLDGDVYYEAGENGAESPNAGQQRPVRGRGGNGGGFNYTRRGRGGGRGYFRGGRGAPRRPAVNEVAA